MFEAEALGLGAMYNTRTIRVPKPFKVHLHLSIDLLAWSKLNADLLYLGLRAEYVS